MSYVDEDATVRFKLLPKQLEVLESIEPMTAYIAGLGSGKTKVGTLWTAKNVAEYPAALHGVCALTNAQLSIAIEQRLVADLALIGITAAPRTNPRRLVCDNGAEVHLRSIDNPEPLLGSEFDFLWADEFDFYPPRALRILRERLRGRIAPYPRFLGTSTPNGFREAYRIFVKEAKPGRTRLIQSETRENFFLDPDYIADLERGYEAFPGLADQQLRGKFVPIGAMRVCPAFERAKHAARPLTRDPSTPLILCFDFNVSRMVCHFAQERFVDVGGKPVLRVQFLRTIRAPHLDSLADAILAAAFTTNDRGLRVPPPATHLYGDAPQGSLHSPQTGRTGWDYLRTRLAPLAPQPMYPSTNPPVVDRVVAVNAAFAAGLVEVDPSCVDLILDCEIVQWDQSGARLDGSDPERTHAYDAAGYFLHAKHRPNAFRAPERAVDLDLNARPRHGR